MPFANLPTELTSAIFEWVVRLDRHPTTISVGWTLSQVCTPWAKLSLGPSAPLSSIWSRLVFREELMQKGVDPNELVAIRQVLKTTADGAESRENSLYEAFTTAVAKLYVSSDTSAGLVVEELLLLTLKLSGNRPLSIFSEGPTPIPLPWIHHLARHTSRWQGVEFLIEQTHAPVLSHLDYPLLQTFEMNTHLKYPDARVWSYPPELQIHSAPHLRRITIRLRGSNVSMLGPIKVSFPWGYITHLELDGPYVLPEHNNLSTDPADKDGVPSSTFLIPLPNLICLQTDRNLSCLATLYAPRLRHLVMVESPLRSVDGPKSPRGSYYRDFITVLIDNSKCALESLEFRIPGEGFPDFSNPSIHRVLEHKHARGSCRLCFSVVDSRKLSSINWEALGLVPAVQNLDSLELRTINSAESLGPKAEVAAIGENPNSQWASAFLKMISEHLTSLKTLCLNVKDAHGQAAFRSTEALDLLRTVRERALVIDDCGTSFHD
ncbi:hypothetical protein V5O48_006847 [Marasmius crinis-equi]|uniref:F-box domain-containing protein n=1 Tax=Marasmius crinis-equi TaxID=585013 RepID=A0ABR3FIE8_9AGAR